MPDALFDARHYGVIDDPIVDHRREARLALGHACAALHWAHDADRHGSALDCIGSAADHIEQAAAHSPAHRDTLLPLAVRLYEICEQTIGWPCLDPVPGIEAAARAVLAGMGERDNG